MIVHRRPDPSFAIDAPFKEQAGKKRRTAFGMGVFALLLLVSGLGWSSAASAAAEGFKGWCTTTGLGGAEACTGDPMSACKLQHDSYNPGKTFYGYSDSGSWYVKFCSWETTGGPLPSLTAFRCDDGYNRLPPGICVKEDENVESRDPQDPPEDCSCGSSSTNNGGNTVPRTCHPIDLMTGSKLFDVVDFTTADGSLRLERVYNSISYGNQIGVMRRSPWGIGQGWRFNFQHEIHLNEDQAIIELETASGSSLKFRGNTSGIFSAAQHDHSGVSQTDFAIEFVGSYPTSWSNVLSAPSQWRVKDAKDRSWLLQTYLEPSSGKYMIAMPISVTFRGGLQWTFTYGPYHELTSIVDSYGKTISFTWNMQSQAALGGSHAPEPISIKSATLPDTTSIQYVADSINNIISINDRLISVEHRDGSSNLLDKTSYLHENSDFPYFITGVVDTSNTRRWSVSYDARGRATTSAGPNNANASNVSYGTISGPTLTRTVTNALGKQSTYSLRWQYGVSELSRVDGSASANCPASADNVYSFTSEDHFIDSSTDAEGRVTKYTRNSLGQPTQIIDGYGTAGSRTTSITWNNTFRVPNQIVQPGVTTDYAWGSAGQLLQVTQTDTTSQSTPYSTNGQSRIWTYTYDSYGALLTVDGPLSGTGDKIAYTYNSLGYLASVTNEVGQTTTVSAVDGRGLPTAVVDPNNIASNLTYDSEQRLTSVTVDPSGLNAVTTISYNVVGDVTQVTRPNGSYLQYTYDDGRRITKVLDNNGSSIEIDRDNLGNATARRIKDSGGTLQLSQTAVFDELGRLLRFVGASSQTWTNAFDKTHNLVSVTDPRSNLFHWSFDSLNRFVSSTDEDSNTVTLTRNGHDDITNYSDPRSLNTSYVRNGFGEVIQRNSPDSGTTVYVYNVLGRPTQITDGRGVVTNLTYDSAGRLLTKQYPAATSENITYSWDDTTSGNRGIGRLTAIQDASGSIGWIYNSLGQVTQENKTTSSVVYTVGYTYDLSGNVMQITYPSGRIVTYSRDATGMVTGVTTQATSSSSPSALASNVGYQPFGPLRSLTYGNGLVLSKTFTQDYSLNTLTVDLGLNSVLNRGYGYANGDFDITNVWDNNVSARTENYVYTPSHRLQNTYGSWGELTYWQDGVGNRTADIFNDGTTTTTKTLSYPNYSNLYAGTSQGGATVRSPTYDGAGNMITDTRGSTVYSYRYNNRGRLDQLTVGSTVNASYGYDGLERMSVRATQNMTPSGITHYVYDRAGRILMEASGTGTVQREYVWLDDMPLAVFADLDTASPKQWYVHADHLDRPVKMTDAVQAVVWEAYYWPYGEVRSITGSASNNLRFPGQYFLVESGLHYNWHRHYDPTLGRYIQADPLGLIDGPSLYAYVGGNPIGAVDPRGLAEIPSSVPGGIPGGPWTPAGAGQQPGTFYGPKQPSGPKSICRWVPPELEGGPPGSQGYWKTQDPGQSGWNRYSPSGSPLTADEAHPNLRPNSPFPPFARAVGGWGAGVTLFFWPSPAW